MKHTVERETSTTINRPIVIIPAEEYEILLKEAGYKPTPHLNRRIVQARESFRKRKFLPWKRLKDELF